MDFEIYSEYIGGNKKGGISNEKIFMVANNT
jgi:hypothetical protein